MFNRQIGIDLGTANVLVYVKGKRIVLNEPSVVAISNTDNRLLAVGTEAKAMEGRVPADVTVTRPMRNGVIADYSITLAMLRYFIGKVCGRFNPFKPEVMVCVPGGVTSVEWRAVRDASEQAGAKVAYPIEEPLAAAIGAKLPIHLPSGHMVVDIGGGTTEAAVISLNGIVVNSSTRVAGDKLDEAITNYIKRRYGLMIGERTAEDLKIQIGSALPLNPEETAEVRGRDQVGGLPKTITVRSNEITDCMAEILTAVIATIKEVLEKTPPELAADIMNKGIILTGGTALLRNIDRLIAQETGIHCYIAEDPMACVATGAGMALDKLDVLRLRKHALASER